ncbi:hypothetical protein Tco_1034378, partial [Tanacetum coccineum]
IPSCVMKRERKAKNNLLMAIVPRSIWKIHGMMRQKRSGNQIRTSKSSTNKVKSSFTGAYSTCTPSTSSTNISEKEILADFADEVIYSLFAKQSEDWDLLHEDMEQIDDLDIEEMDINWHIAMIAIRMKKFYKKTGRRVRVNGKTPVVLTKRSLNASIVTTLVTLLGNVQQRGHMMERRRETHFIYIKKLGTQ